MKYALINEEKTEASEGAKGFCPSCKNEVFAKCGDYRVKHWAHKGNRDCDPWRESETEWHREWKNLFPKEWQENIHTDSSTGEKHVADVKTDKGFIIEFQHSPIKADEVKSREDFYKNMVWVVDGTGLPRDYQRFCKGSNDFDSSIAQARFSSSNWEGVFFTYFPEECFPKRWLTSSVPVYFDFQGIAPLEQREEKSTFLWGLLPGDIGGWSVVVKLRRKDFIERSLTAPHLLLALEIRSYIEQERVKEKQEEENLREAEWRQKHQADPLQQLLMIQRQRRRR
ncbi:MAG: competence protein CoiA family protein [Geobacteraceae bacterium]|nr:competence protein CoiA family protein [Geobacteraceae bacterium]